MSEFQELIRFADTKAGAAVTLEAVGADHEMKRRRARRITADAILVEIGNSLCKPSLCPLAIKLIEEIRLAERLGLAEVVHLWRNSAALSKPGLSGC